MFLLCDKQAWDNNNNNNNNNNDNDNDNDNNDHNITMTMTITIIIILLLLLLFNQGNLVSNIVLFPTRALYVCTFLFVDKKVYVSNVDKVETSILCRTSRPAHVPAVNMSKIAGQFEKISIIAFSRKKERCESKAYSL